MPDGFPVVVGKAIHLSRLLPKSVLCYANYTSTSAEPYATQNFDLLLWYKASQSHAVFILIIHYESLLFLGGGLLLLELL